jgi:hypothetical protein
MKKFGAWEVEDIEVEDINWKDVPDFCNAFISNATIDGEEATEKQLEALNDDGDFRYECIMDYIF